MPSKIRYKHWKVLNIYKSFNNKFSNHVQSVTKNADECNQLTVMTFILFNIFIVIYFKNKLLYDL